MFPFTQDNADSKQNSNFFIHMEDLQRVFFGFLSGEDIRRLSVCAIVQPQIFDSLGRPLSRGLYDLSMGPVLRDSGSCITCGLSQSQCPGHFGHIELASLVYHPILFPYLYRLMRGTCLSCRRFRVPLTTTLKTRRRLQLLDLGLLQDSLDFETGLDYDSLHTKPSTGGGADGDGDGGAAAKKTKKKKAADSDEEMLTRISLTCVLTVLASPPSHFLFFFYY